MAQTQAEFREYVRVAMVDNSNYPALAGQPMPAEMKNELEDSMARLSNVIWTMVASWVLGLDGDEFPDENVRADEDDVLPGFLIDKVDDITLAVDLVTHRMYIKESPLATDVTRGGVTIGAQTFLYLSGSNLMLNAENNPALVGGNNMVPTSRAVKLYVDSLITSGSGGGDMLKSTYDTDNNGVVDDSERLENQVGSYYLDWNNFSNTPTTIANYGITDAYTIIQVDDFFEGEVSGKKQVDWTRIINPPDILTLANQGDNRVVTSDGTSTGLTSEASFTFDGTTMYLDGESEVTGTVTTNAIKLNQGVSFGSMVEGLIWWNEDEYTLNIDTGLGPILQVGQETYLLIYNDTASTITNLTVLRPKAATVISGVVVPTVEKAVATTYNGVEGTIMVATMDIPPSSIGLATRFGRVRGGDASGIPYGETWANGDNVFISETPGQLTNIRPSFPSYNISVGGVINNATSPDGEVFVSITREPSDTILNFWNGTIREAFNFIITSNGTTITGSLSDDNTGDILTYMFTDGFTVVDVSTPLTITLTAGTDTVPVVNYIYIPVSTKVLTVSTSDWPSEEHIKIATALLRSAATTQTEGALTNQNWNEHIQGNNGQGHLSHIGEKLRRLGAQWDSGCEGNAIVRTAPSPDEVYVTVTGGLVYQLHKQTFPAFDTEVSDDIHVYNHPTTPYLSIQDLATQTLDSTGATLINKYYSFVIWGSINKTGEPSQIFLNLPMGSYLSYDNALNDPNNYSVYTIPKNFQGTGFLICRFIFSNTAAGASWTLEATEDLRGKVPNTSAGGGSIGGSGVTTFIALTDVPASYSGEALKILQVNAGETGLEFTNTPTFTSLTVNNSINLAGTPGLEGLFFGDGDTGLLESADDILNINIAGTNVMSFGISGAINLLTLGSDDTEDHVIAIDDATGLLTKRSVASIIAGAGGVDWGTATNEYIVLGSTGGDIESSSDFTFNTASGILAVNNSTGGEIDLRYSGVSKLNLNTFNTSASITTSTSILSLYPTSNDSWVTIGNSYSTSTWLTIRDVDTTTPMTNILSIVNYAGIDIFKVLSSGVVYMVSLGSDDTEDHLVAIDDSTGLLTKRSVASLAGGGDVSWGTATNKYVVYGSTGGDIESDSSFLYDTTTHVLSIDGGASDGGNINLKYNAASVLSLNALASYGQITGSSSLMILPASGSGIAIGPGIQAGNYLTIRNQNALGYTNIIDVQNTSGSSVFEFREDGTAYFISLGSDDAEDHVVAIDDATGLLTKRSVASITGASGLVWSGSTANGVATYGDANTVVAESDLTYNTYTLNIHGNIASSVPLLILDNDTSSGDTSIRFANSTYEFSMGVDGSDSQKVKLYGGSDLGSTDGSTALCYDFNGGTALVGIAKNSPTVTLHVGGSGIFEGDLGITNDVTANAGIFNYTATTNWDSLPTSGLSYIAISTTHTNAPGNYTVGFNMAQGSTHRFQIAAYYGDIDRFYYRHYGTNTSSWQSWVRFALMDDVNDWAANEIPFAGDAYHFTTSSNFTYNSTTLYVHMNSAVTTPLLWLDNDTASGDTVIRFDNSSYQYVMGIDGTDSQKFKIMGSSVLGTSDGSTALCYDFNGGNALVGIGESAPSYTLHVNGSGYFTGAFYLTGISNLTNTNYLRYNSTTGLVTYLSSSDIRLKENIELWEPDSLTFLVKQDLIKFDRKDGSSKGEVGWNATQMSELMPDMTWEDERGFINFKEAHFPMHFHRAIKQLYARIEELEEELKSIKSKGTII